MMPIEDVYCPICRHCGDVYCCGIGSFIKHHLKGKTGCLYEDELLQEIEVAMRHHLMPTHVRYWVDDERPVPDGRYISIHSVDEMLAELDWLRNDAPKWLVVEVIDLDHDAGEYAKQGGDYIKILDYMEQCGDKYPVAFHTQNAVGRQNMLRIANKNNLTVMESVYGV